MDASAATNDDGIAAKESALFDAAEIAEKLSFCGQRAVPNARSGTGGRGGGSGVGDGGDLRDNQGRRKNRDTDTDIGNLLNRRGLRNEVAGHSRQ